MSARPSPVPLARQLAAAALALALVVVLLGAYVRLSDAGLGCPDWPGCYGRLLAPTEPGDIATASASWPERPVEVPKAWKEMVHRYVAGALGLLVLVLAITALRDTATRTKLGPAALVLLGVVLIQAMLGMLTVTWLLKPLVVVAHLVGGFTVLVLLWWMLLSASAWFRPQASARAPSPAWALCAIAVVLMQTLLGGWTSSNYAALACTDFPTCQGSLWPDADWQSGFRLWRGLGTDYEFGVLDTPARTAIHHAHRLGAAITTLVLLAVALRTWRAGSARYRRTALLLLAALATQVALGIGNVVLGLPLYNAVAHTGGAALLLLTAVTLLYFTLLDRRREHP